MLLRMQFHVAFKYEIYFLIIKSLRVTVARHTEKDLYTNYFKFSRHQTMLLCFLPQQSLPIVRFRVIPYLYKSVEELRIIYKFLFLFETCYKDNLHILCDTNMQIRVHVFFELPFFVYVIEYKYFTCVVTSYNTVYKR